MPKSKRETEVSLTKIKKKTRQSKGELIMEIRDCANKYSSLYVLSLENLRSHLFMQVRQHFKKNSEVYFGANYVMALALGKSEEDEAGPGLHKVGPVLKGQCALLFTNETPASVKKYFDEFSEADYARAGAEVDEEMTLSKGPIESLAGSMEPYLRKLGLPIKLNKGIIELTKDYVICKAGDTLTPDQAKILKLMEMKTSLFKVTVRARWLKDKGFKVLC